MKRRDLLRLMDASSNRALEGIRVCEEIVRLSWNGSRLFRRVRALRHSIAHAIRSIPAGQIDLVRARDIRNDVGRRAATSRVDSLDRLLVINLQRTKEALRTLEESARLISPKGSSTFQRLRFRTYEVERELMLRLASLRHSRLRRHR